MFAMRLLWKQKETTPADLRSGAKIITRKFSAKIWHRRKLPGEEAKKVCPVLDTSLNRDSVRMNTAIRR